MQQILLPIDPTEPQRTRAAIARAVAIRREAGAHLHLLRVLPRVSGHVAMFFGHHELQQLQLESGTEDLTYARSLLEAAGVPYQSTVLVGRSAETIAAAARQLHCDRILFGNEGPGLAGRAFGSLAHQVRHLLGAGDACQVIG
jgi:nucleotide-binding universal stress UspA family protein